MLVVVVIYELPFLDGVEPRLDDRRIWKCLSIECVHECLGVIGACQVIEKSAGHHDLPLNVRHHFTEVNK